MADNQCQWKMENMWTLKSPVGETLISIRHDGEQYVVVPTGGVPLGKSWDDARREAERIAAATKPRKGGKR